MGSSGRRGAVAVVVLAFVGCVFASQPAFYLGYWITDLLRAFVPLALAGYLISLGWRKTAAGGAAVVVLAAVLSVAWMVLVTPVWPAAIHPPMMGMPRVATAWPVLELTRSQLLYLGLQLSPGAAVRAAVPFVIGVAFRSALSRRRLAPAL